MKKIVLIVVSLLLVSAMVFGCAPAAQTTTEAAATEAPAAEATEAAAEATEAPAADDEIVVAGIVFQDDQFMKSMTEGFVAAGEEYGIEILTANTNNDQTKEAELIQTYIAQGGIEYAKKLLIKSVGPEAARKIIDRLTKALESSAGFTSIERANPQQLSKFIQNEHPQTIALILAHLNASQAGDLIASLPEHLRADVAMRMANLQEISPEVVRRISLILEQKLEALGSFATEAYGGVRAVAELFNRMDRTTGRLVLEKIENENPQLAASIRDLMFVFDDILLIDETGITEILKRADKKVLTIAPRSSRKWRRPSTKS